MLGCAPSVDWLDGGSLTASAWLLGVAHPPGEPGWLAPARLAQLLPVGDIAFRVNLLSALTVAACAAPLLWLTRAAVGGRAGLGGAFAVGVALLGYGARMQAGRAEVYGPVALLLLLALAAVVCLPGRRGAAAGGLLLGMSAGVHPLLAAAATPGLLVAAWLRSDRGLADGALAGGFGLLGFAVYGWLPLRAAANPARAWGIPDTPERFLDVLLGRTFSRNFGGDEGSLAANIGVVLERHALSGVLVAVVLAGIGLVLLRGAGGETRARRALVWAAPVWVLGNAMTILPQNKVFGTNPDVLGYLLVGTLAVAPLGGLGVALLRRQGPGSPLERVGPWVIGAAALVFGWQAVDGLSASRTRNQLGRQFSVAQAHALPPGATLLTSGNDTAFLWTYLQAVERRRPDMVAMHRVLLGHPHERLRLQSALADRGIAWTPELRTRPAEQLAHVPDAFIEVREPERPLLGSALHRHGLVWGVRPRPETPALASVREQAVAALQGPLARGDDEAALVAALFLDLNGGSP